MEVSPEIHTQQDGAFKVSFPCGGNSGLSSSCLSLSGHSFSSPLSLLVLESAYPQRGGLSYRLGTWGLCLALTRHVASRHQNTSLRFTLRHLQSPKQRKEIGNGSVTRHLDTDHQRDLERMWIRSNHSLRSCQSRWHQPGSHLSWRHQISFQCWHSELGPSQLFSFPSTL